MIKFNLIKGDKYILFRIISQSDFMAEYLPFEYVVFNKSLLRIDVIEHPQIRIDSNENAEKIRIFLRGSVMEKNEYMSHVNFDDNIERDKVYDLILLAFNDLKKRWDS